VGRRDVVDVREATSVKRVAIIQARTGSVRLPGKVLADLAGQPMLAHVVRRVSLARSIDQVAIATTELAADDAIVEMAESLGIAAFRGSETDVLARYVGAARQFKADVVVRLTADCPLLDPGVIDRVVNALCAKADQTDYVSNVIDRTYPRGLDAEALFADVLERIDRRARSAAAREHVTYYLRSEHPELFSLRSIVDVDDNSDLRWTVDEPADLELVRSIFKELELATADRPYREVLGWVRQHPAAATVNAHVRQKGHAAPGPEGLRRP
jgi:spore coat polysaccharide biosynthesis protein SpsF